MDRMRRTDQLVRSSDGRYLTFDPAEVAALYATDTRQSAQLYSLRASRLSPPTPPHYARACVLRWDAWIVRSSQTSTYCACAGGRSAEADLRHVSVSERPTTDIRETCTPTMLKSFVRSHVLQTARSFSTTSTASRLGPPAGVYH